MKTRPRVGFDAYFLEHPMTGMGQYATRLWRELARRDELDARLLLPADAPDFVRDLAGERGVPIAPPAGARLSKRLRKVWWEQRGVVRAARKARVDLVHIPYFSAPLSQPAPLVVTIHDAIPLVLDHYAGGRVTRSYLKVVGRASRQAHLILTDSRHAAGDIAKHLGIPLDRIRPIHLAAGDEFTSANGEMDDARIASMRERFGLEGPFVLNVGGFDQRKNLISLIEGFALARPKLDDGLQLVIVGSPHGGNRDLFPDIGPALDRHGLRERVTLTGFVSEEDKLDLYRAATAFVFPSMYEGFGLNPLEAMACGTPVIASNRSSLPEVVGDAGLSVDPTPRALAEAMVTLLNDEALRDDLRRRGLKRAAGFSWKETASQTIGAYHDVLQSLS